jgi:hypothetical protein
LIFTEWSVNCRRFSSSYLKVDRSIRLPYVPADFSKDSELVEIESNILPKVIRTAKRNNQ